MKLESKDREKYIDFIIAEVKEIEKTIKDTKIELKETERAIRNIKAGLEIAEARKIQLQRIDLNEYDLDLQTLKNMHVILMLKYEGKGEEGK